MKRPQTHEFVTIPEASRRTGLGLRQFRRAIDTGGLAIFDVGGWPRVRWTDVLGWIEASKRSNADSLIAPPDAPERT